MAKFCIYCGAPLQSNHKFCAKCGKAVAQEEAAPEVPVSEPALPEEEVPQVIVPEVPAEEITKEEPLAEPAQELPPPKEPKKKKGAQWLFPILAVMFLVTVLLRACGTENTPEPVTPIEPEATFTESVSKPGTPTAEYTQEAQSEQNEQLARDIEFILNRAMFFLKDDLPELYSSAVNDIQTLPAYQNNWTFREVLNEANFDQIQWSYDEARTDTGRCVNFCGKSKAVDYDLYVEIQFFMTDTAIAPIAWSMNSLADGEPSELSATKFVQTGMDTDMAFCSADAGICCMLAIMAWAPEETADTTGFVPPVDSDQYIWEGNDVFSTFYQQYHASTGAVSWEHIGHNGSTYRTPNDINPVSQFDLYCVTFGDGSKTYYGIKHGEIQLTDVYEIQPDNSLVCVWSVPLEEYYEWMQVPTANTGYAAYDEKLNEYIDVATMCIDEFQDTYAGDDSSINATIMDYYHSFGGMSLAYALYDVDSNGTPELIISDTHNIIDIYTLNNGSLVKLFPNCYYGDRSRLHILSDGRLMDEGSSGVSSGSCALYQFTNGGTSVAIEEAYYCDGMGSSEYMDDTYTYVTMDECMEKQDAWMALAIFDTLSWNVFASN